jgi:hypothetical protein
MGIVAPSIRTSTALKQNMNLPNRTLANSLRVGFVICAVSSTARCIADEPTATPYRPTVSTPAALSEPGWLELEAGGQLLKDDRARRDSLPYSLKLAFGPNWGVRVGGEATVQQRNEDGTRHSGYGDTSLILKYRLPMNGNSAFGIEAGFKSPTARQGLGSGKADALFNFIYSADLAAYHVDLNLAPTHLGAIDRGQDRLQTGWATAVSHALSEKWGIAGELSGTAQKGAATTSQALIALSYATSKRTVFDFGVARGLASAAPDWNVFFGVTILAARLW